MPFFQEPPSLGNQYTQDRVLQSFLARVLPEDVRRAVEPTLVEMGELAGGELARTFAEDRASEPRLVQWDAWGHRVDRIEITATWKLAARIAVEKGLIAT